MAFNIGYVGLCDRNIKHIYTTTHIKPPATRKPLPYKPEFIREQDRANKEREKNRRFMQYYPIHDIELPKAPSFRTLPKSIVDDAVDRLVKTSRERFNFKFNHTHAYNDWRGAHQAKIQRLRDVMAKFGAKTHRPELDMDPEIDSKDRTDGKTTKRTKGKKKKEINGMGNNTETVDNTQLLKEKSDYVEKLPPLQ